MTASTDLAASKPNMLTRNDTMLGICQSLGDDFGFNPDFLRVAIGIALIWQPVLTIAVYLAVGIVVMAARLLSPDRAKAVADIGDVAEPSQPSLPANQSAELAQAA